MMILSVIYSRQSFCEKGSDFSVIVLDVMTSNSVSNSVHDSRIFNRYMGLRSFLICKGCHLQAEI